jgi:hypothetical protein
MMLMQARKVLRTRTVQQRLATIPNNGSVVTNGSVGTGRTFCHPRSTLSFSPSLSSSSTSIPLNHPKHWKDISSERYFSSTSQEARKDDTQAQDPHNEREESLKDTVRRMGGKHNSGTDDTTTDPRLNELLNKVSNTWSTFSEEVGKAWGDLLRSGERKDINKKLRHPEDTVEGEREYTGPVDIMLIDESEHLTAWERMQKRLTEAPIIQGRQIERGGLSLITNRQCFSLTHLSGLHNRYSF